MLIRSEEKKILKLYAAFVSVRDIASICDISVATIYTVLKRNDIPKRGQPSISPELHTQVADLYNKGASLIDISEMTGVLSEQTIYVILRERSVKVRRKLATREGKEGI